MSAAKQYSEYTFRLAGWRGDDARKSLSPAAQLIWTVEADSHYAAMTAYYKFMGWGTYTTDQKWDMKPFPMTGRKRDLHCVLCGFCRPLRGLGFFWGT